MVWPGPQMSSRSPSIVSRPVRVIRSGCTRRPRQVYSRSLRRVLPSPGKCFPHHPLPFPRASSADYRVALEAINAVEQAEESARAEASTPRPQRPSQEPADQHTGSSDGGS
jgi:hypothetical protein